MDPVSLTAVTIASMAATAAGAGVSAYGQYQGGQAQSRMYQYQAGVNNALAGIAARNANYDIVSGEVKAQQAGLVGAANVSRGRAFGGARNVSIETGAGRQVTESALAISKENQNIQRADAAHAAYGEQVQAAEKTATAGAMGIAGQTAVAAGDIGAVGSIVSGVGSVAGKWYDVASVNPLGPSASTPNYPLSGPVTEDFMREG